MTIQYGGTSALPCPVTHIYVLSHIQTYTYKVHRHIYMYTYIHGQMHINMCEHTCTHKRANLCTYTYMYVHPHVHMQTYIHTYTLWTVRIYTISKQSPCRMAMASLRFSWGAETAYLGTGVSLPVKGKVNASMCCGILGTRTKSRISHVTIWTSMLQV